MLYHGSATSGIKMFEPVEHRAVEGKPVVFATDDRAYALAMIYGTGDELAVSYAVNPKTNQRELYIDELQPDKLNLLNNKGTLYEVDDTYFRISPEGLEAEYISFTEVPVVNESEVKNIKTELESLNVNLIGYDKVIESMGNRVKIKNTPVIIHDENRFK